MKHVLIALAIVAAVPTVARANGDNAHAWISLHAVEHLPDGELKRLLSQPELQTMLINGSIFPDGGYVIGDDYGEMAHWEPFVEAYVRWVRDNFDHPLTEGDAAQEVAFLMGVASHGMADQVFDSTFVDAARLYDAANWSEEFLKDIDSASDVMLVDETGVHFLDLGAWVPADDVSAVFHEQLGYDVTAGTLDSAQELLHRLVLNYAETADATKVQEVRAQYPWTSEHVMDAAQMGSPPCEGEVVADYWLALWDRLHEVSGPQNWVIQTYPRDGAAGHPTDSTIAEARVVIVFGHGIKRVDLEGHFTVTDGTGKSYPLTADTQWGTAEANLVKLTPDEDWAENQTFTVTVSPGLPFNDGTVMDQPFSFTFSTTPAPITDPSSDPTPHEGEPDIGRAPDSGGCCSSSGGEGSAALALLVLFAATRPRRARS